MKTTVIPPVKIRYNYSTPSMSRRGGTRLHPIKDGTAPMGEQLTMLRHRDKSGQKLRDVIHPVTGYCIAVTSPLEGPVSGKGTAGSHTAETRRAAVVHVPEKQVYADEETGFVIRTCDMGDNPRPVAWVSGVAQKEKERPVREARGTRDAKPRPVAPGGTGPGGRITDEDCLAYIKAAAKGREVRVTKYMIEQARVILKNKQAAARKLLNGGK